MACTRVPSSIRNLAEQLWIGSETGAQLLVRDPNHGSAEQRRLSSLPAGHAQGYAQCFENYVADSYAAVDAHAGNGKVPDGPAHLRRRRPSRGDLRCDAAVGVERRVGQPRVVPATSASQRNDDCDDTPAHSTRRASASLRSAAKGQSLARLASAGLPVPHGFHITTAAYDDVRRRAPSHEPDHRR